MITCCAGQEVVYIGIVHKASIANLVEAMLSMQKDKIQASSNQKSLSQPHNLRNSHLHPMIKHLGVGNI